MDRPTGNRISLGCIEKNSFLAVSLVNFRCGLSVKLKKKMKITLRSYKQTSKRKRSSVDSATQTHSNEI